MIFQNLLHRLNQSGLETKRLLIAALFCSVLGSSAQAQSSSSLNASGVRETTVSFTPQKKAPLLGGSYLVYFDGLELNDILVEEGAQEALTGHPIVVALAGAFINHGLEGLKAWIEASAKRYEIKTTGRSNIRIAGLDLSDFATPPLLNKGGVLYLVKYVDVPDTETSRKTFGHLLMPVEGSELSSDLISEAGLKLKGLPHKEVLDMAENSLPAKKDKYIRVLSFAAVIVVQPASTKNQLDTAGVEVVERAENAFQFVLAGYTYPVVQSRDSAFPAPKEAKAEESKDKIAKGIRSIKTLLSVSLSSPGGLPKEALDGRGGYEANTIFPVKPDEIRNEPAGTWVVPTKMQRLSSPLFWNPPSQFLLASGSVVETSKLKKTLENIAKVLGKVKLTPADFGISAD